MHNALCWLEDYLDDVAHSAKSGRLKQLFEELSVWTGRAAVLYVKLK